MSVTMRPTQCFVYFGAGKQIRLGPETKAVMRFESNFAVKIIENLACRSEHTITSSVSAIRTPKSGVRPETPVPILRQEVNFRGSNFL